MVVNADNQRSTALTKSLVSHDHSKHIDIHYYYARDLVKEGRITLEDVPMTDMLADLPAPALVMYTCLKVSDCFGGLRRVRSY
jgi:hypothetical protein